MPRWALALLLSSTTTAAASDAGSCAASPDTWVARMESDPLDRTGCTRDDRPGSSLPSPNDCDVRHTSSKPSSLRAWDRTSVAVGASVVVGTSVPSLQYRSRRRCSACPLLVRSRMDTAAYRASSATHSAAQATTGTTLTGSVSACNVKCPKVSEGGDHDRERARERLNESARKKKRERGLGC